MNARERQRRSAGKLRIIDGRAQVVVDPIAPARGVVLSCAVGAAIWALVIGTWVMAR